MKDGPFDNVISAAVRVARCPCCNALQLHFLTEDGKLLAIYEMQMGQSVDRLLEELAGHRRCMSDGPQRGADRERHMAMIERLRQESRGDKLN